MQPVLSVLNLKMRVKEAEFPSFYRDKQSKSPSVSSASTGKQRGNGGVEETELMWEGLVVIGDSVIFGRLQTDPTSTSVMCQTVLLPPRCWYRPCPPSHDQPFLADLHPPRTTPAPHEALLVQ